MNLGPVELILILVIAFVPLAVTLVAGYWVVRLAVRDGLLDARRRAPGQDRIDV
jgi:hypothetical protein